MSETPSERQTGISKPIVARVLWRLSIALLWFVSICAGALAAVTLWVIVGFSPEPQKSDANTLGSQF